MDSQSFDLVVVGAGPAGLTAALYARRAGKSVMVLEKDTFGGQITHSPKVENYPGFSAISGNEFAEKLMDQVLSLGANIDVDSVTDITDCGDCKKITTERCVYEAKAVIVAAGSKHRQLGLPGENDLIGSGVSYCVLCDGAFFAGREVAVIGGGNTALQEAVLLAETCKKVTVIQNLAFLTGEASLTQNLAARTNVDYIYNSIVAGLEAQNGELVALTLKDTADGKESRFPVNGVFVAIGQVPENEPFHNVCNLDERGYIVAGEDCLTCTPGVFVAGDCRTKNVRQITTATGDGAAAALAACRFIESLR